MKLTPPFSSANTPKTLERCQTMKPTDMSSMPPLRNIGSSESNWRSGRSMVHSR